MTHTSTILGAALVAAICLGVGCERGNGLVARGPVGRLDAAGADAVVAPSVDPGRSSASVPDARDPGRRAASLARVDARVGAWIAHVPEVGSNVACAMTCHTAMPAALAHGAIGAHSPALDTLRAAISLRVASVDDWSRATPFYGEGASAKARESRSSEAVLDALSLAAIDRARGVDADETRRAFDHMWAMQRSDGGFDWLDFGLEPFEAGESTIGAALAGRAVALRGEAPSDAHAPRIAKLHAYLLAALGDPATIGFDKALMLWGIAGIGAAPSDELTRWYAEIAQAQAPDGAWSWSALGVVGARGRLEGGDALPTAIAVLGLCTATDERAVWARDEGVAWLVRAQGSDGGFASLSPNRDRPFNDLLASDAATGFAAVALATCAR